MCYPHTGYYISLMDDLSIFRFHVNIHGKRTTISLDPDLFRALTFKLGGITQAKSWIIIKSATMTKTNKSISRQIQSAISLLLVDLVSSDQQPIAQAKYIKHTPSVTTFQSDELPV